MILRFDVVGTNNRNKTYCIAGDEVKTVAVSQRLPVFLLRMDGSGIFFRLLADCWVVS